MQPKRGRPAGFLLNPESRYLLGARPQSWWAAAAGLSTAHLSEMLAGGKGATLDVAQRLANALDPELPIGLIFPELAQFRTTIRHFTAPMIEEAAA